jgi:hypothetical protein
MNRDRFRPTRHEQKATKDVFVRCRDMSMYDAPDPRNTRDIAYMVPTPLRSDVLSVTLRSAYRPAEDANETFGDLLRALDRIRVE